MRVDLLCIGKTADKTIKKLLDYYAERLPRHWNFSLTEIPDLKNARSLTPAQIKGEEEKLLLQKIEAGDYVILLDEGGKQWTSREFAAKMEDFQNSSRRAVVLVIGGAYGFSENMYQRASEKLSLSKMTFTHQMVRLFLMEQLYRADQILQGKPYHND